MSRFSERLRVSALVVLLLLFFARVVGQIEVLLLGPKWLPPMEVWFPGLLPYPVLLPLQILLLMFMSLIVCDHWRGRGFSGPRGPRCASPCARSPRSTLAQWRCGSSSR